MAIIDLQPDQFRRVIKGKKPRSRWSWINPRNWAAIDWVIAILLLTLFVLLFSAGGLEFALGGMFGIGFWISELIWWPIGWLMFLLRIAGTLGGF